MGDRQLDVLKAMNEHYAHLFRRVHYLFLAHGAGLGGGLTFLKDLAPSTKYQGVGLPVVMFGIGLLSAIASYIALSFAKMLANNAVLDRKNPEKSNMIFWFYYGGLFVSLAALIGAVSAIIWTAAKL